MEPLGTRIRRHRRRAGLTLDDLSAKTGISKPYLSLIETGRVNNPPSDEKLARIERVLDFAEGELVSQAHLLRTPRDVRAMLAELVGASVEQANAAGEDAGESRSTPSERSGRAGVIQRQTSSNDPAAGRPAGVSLDSPYMSGLLRQLVDRRGTNVETVPVGSVPIINKISAGYPKDFTDLSYPRGVADAYLSCPDLADPDAFAARVSGDSMTPKYRPGEIVIFSPAAAVRSGDDAFVRLDDGQTTFKRVFFEKDDAGHDVIRLQPRNKQYRPQIFPADRVTGVYRAVFRYQSVDD